MALHAEAEEPLAMELLNWAANFGVGRFLNEDQGFCIAKAPAYYMNLKNSKDQWITSWKEFAEVNLPGVKCDSTLKVDGYPEWAGGYAANARAMLASASNLGVPGAETAYKLLQSKTPLMDKDYANDPTWAIVPR